MHFAALTLSFIPSYRNSSSSFFPVFIYFHEPFPALYKSPFIFCFYFVWINDAAVYFLVPLFSFPYFPSCFLPSVWLISQQSCLYILYFFLFYCVCHSFFTLLVLFLLNCVFSVLRPNLIFSFESYISTLFRYRPTPFLSIRTWFVLCWSYV
jgi:hypothetical protein